MNIRQGRCMDCIHYHSGSTPFQGKCKHPFRIIHKEDGTVHSDGTNVVYTCHCPLYEEDPRANP